MKKFSRSSVVLCVLFFCIFQWYSTNAFFLWNVTLHLTLHDNYVENLRLFQIPWKVLQSWLYSSCLELELSKDIIRYSHCETQSMFNYYCKMCDSKCVFCLVYYVYALWRFGRAKVSFQSLLPELTKDVSNEGRNENMWSLYNS